MRHRYWCLFAIVLLAVPSRAQDGPTFEMGGGPLSVTGDPTADCLSPADHILVSELMAEHVERVAAEDVELAGPGLPLILEYPMAGRWYGDLFTGNYVDLAATPGQVDGLVQDWACGDWTYDGHDATDTSLRTFTEQIIGVPVFAAWDGVVAATHDGELDMNTSWMGQAANFVVLDHGANRFTYYWHLKRFSVAVTVGQMVRAGQQLGETASSGNSTGPHLHFALYENAQLVEPFSGACQAVSSRWRQQRPKPHNAYLLDFGFSRSTLAGITNPVFGMPRTGQLELTDPAVYFWAFVPALPTASNWSVVFLRPDGSVADTTGSQSFGNPGEYRWSWWWWGFNVADMHTIPGTWTIDLWVNGRLLVSAPLEVVASYDPGFNRLPEAVTAGFVPPSPLPGDVAHCRVTTHLGVDDLDYEVLSYHYVWRINGSTVRDVTTAAQSDAIPAGSFEIGDLLECTVTPLDGAGAGPSSTVTRTIDCAAPEVVRVHGRSNLFAAGHAVPDAPGGGGLGYPPVEVPLAGISGDIVSFPSVTGLVSPGAAGTNGADGGLLYGGVTDVTSWDGVAGLVHANRTMFLAGVFLDSNEPADPAPARLDVTGLSTATDVSPLLGQTFFVGDGRTGTGSGALQRFHVPAGATRLLLGFVDASVFVGAPGWYDDDGGELVVTVQHALPAGCVESQPFCEGVDGSLAACPCGNAGSPGSGCNIAQATGGVSLTVVAQQTTPSNRATVAGAGFPVASNPSAVVIRAPGLDLGSPVPFGDGIRCIGVPLVRLGAAIASSGSSIHILGHGPMAGSGTAYYQLWFRNTPMSFCDPMSAFNLSNGRTIAW